MSFFPVTGFINRHFMYLLLYVAPVRVPVDAGRVLPEQREEVLPGPLGPLRPLLLLLLPQLQDKLVEERLPISGLLHAAEAVVLAVPLLKLGVRRLGAELGLGQQFPAKKIKLSKLFIQHKSKDRCRHWDKNVNNKNFSKRPKVFLKREGRFSLRKISEIVSDLCVKSIVRTCTEIALTNLT